MRNDYYSNSKDYINRWVVSYADFVTMLLALFMVMYAVSINGSKELQKTLKNTFSTQPKQEKVLENSTIDEKKYEPELTNDTPSEIFKANSGCSCRFV